MKKKIAELAYDMQAGFKIGLFIALPLCLGVSTASGFPPMAGLISAVISGIVMFIMYRLWQGTDLVITGPAAGMIPIVLFILHGFYAMTPENMIESDKVVLGMRNTLGVFVISGALQITFSLFSALNLKISGYPINLGWFGNFFPSPVIAGLKCSIGGILILTQGFKILGIKPSYVEPKEILFNFFDELNKFEPSLVVLAGLICLISIFFLSSYSDKKILQLVPPSLIVLVIAILIPFGLRTDEIPTISISTDQSKWFSSASFDMLITFHGISSTIICFGVSTIESLVTSSAIQSEDPQKRQRNMNADIFGNGVSNVLIGFLGGLPVINEIVRSHNGVHEGAKTQKVNFFHAICLAVLILSFMNYLVLIPNVALSAILVYTGYSMIKKNIPTARLGQTEEIVMLITVFGIIFTDLLIGVLIGLFAYWIGQYRNIMRFEKGQTIQPIQLFKIGKNNFIETISDHKTFSFIISNLTIFNFQKIKQLLDDHLKNEITLNLEKLRYIDSDSLKNLQEFRRKFAVSGGKLTIEGIDNLQPFSKHPLSSRGDIPSKKGLSILANERQIVLQEIGALYGFQFEKGIKLNNTLVTPFKFFYLGDNQVKNILEGFIDGIKVSICDVSSARFSSLGFRKMKYSVAIIDFGDKKIPQFIQSPETIADILDNTDINFEDYKAYSNHYLLKSYEEADCVALFRNDDAKLLKKFSAYRIHYMESSENKVLIIRKKVREDSEDLPAVIQLVKEIIEIIKGSYPFSFGGRVFFILNFFQYTIFILY
ncbi:MAG TPA: SulP family inorganic anion transporter [Candidatus Absconditabacterales bacterium]|nr:SulP family inorganic anion transporter [Candidatus Absconditabacterales bacterium]